MQNAGQARVILPVDVISTEQGRTVALSHSVSVEELAGNLSTDLKAGLSQSRAAALLAEQGYNELTAAGSQPLWQRVFAQFNELVVWLLIAAAVVSVLLGEWPDATAILAIVLLNAILGFVQEERAERSLAALRTLSAPTAKVIRDGVPVPVPAREVVAGDLIELEAGDYVPADARVVQAFAFQAQEAALTGESTAVSKESDVVLSPATPLADRRNMVFLGTIVASGRAVAIVVATGMRTELGQIAGLLARHKVEPTPLQRRLAELGRVLIFVCLLIVGVILTLQLWRGAPLYEVFMLSVGLAVAAVPEGLPAVVTLALALGLQRMVRRNALVRKLPSVETLGCVTVICSDKTGTLTRNEMTVRELALVGDRFLIGGAGYGPHGKFSRLTQPRNEGQPLADSTTFDPAGNADLLLLLKVGAWCNHARVVPSASGSAWQVIGDPTEGALVVAARKAGIDIEGASFQVIHEIPFDSARRAMSVIVRDEAGVATMYTKGASEAVLEKCHRALSGGTRVAMDDRLRQEILAANHDMAARALRVLALAYRPLDEKTLSEASEETDLTFVGLAGMIDPPREEARQAVVTCHAAGIRPVMITGDHPAMALAIARELEIAGPEDLAVTGQQLDDLSDAELTNRIERIAVYARVSAAHKMRVVEAWQDRGEIVAMTGDGVNDAPAIKAADIGIAMGITGTDVTKEASDMVLMDDNFASIVSAVEEGRGIFDNIQKFVFYLLASNTSEVLLMFFAALVGWPAPLMAVQLLWINLVTDGLPALALGMEPPERDIMQRRPRPPHEPVITRSRGLLILSHGALMTAVAAIGFWLFYQGNATELPRARTAVFCILAFSQLFYSLSCRSLRYTMPELGLFSNPYLFGAIAVSVLAQLCAVTLPVARPVFEAVTQFGRDWLLIGILSLTPVTIIETAKLVIHWTWRTPSTVRPLR